MPQDHPERNHPEPPATSSANCAARRSRPFRSPLYKHNPDAQDGPEAFTRYVTWLCAQYPDLKLVIKACHRRGRHGHHASLRELAADLFISPNTLKTHLRAIYRKLGAESRKEAVICVREGGLI
jgi:hypothetical protein